MARKAEPGISYYRANCDHTRNKKIKLLVNDAGSDGYWIWACILGYTYEKKGYYFDTSDIDELTLFASDECKKPIELVQQVIDICIKRGLFDAEIYQKYKFLTSDRIQDNYLTATEERRRKGTQVMMCKELILVSVESAKNITIVPLDKSNSSGEELPKKQEEFNEETTKETDAKAKKEKKRIEAEARRQDFYQELVAFIPEYGKETVRNFYNYWSEFTRDGSKMRKETEKTWETSRRLSKWKSNETKWEKPETNGVVDHDPSEQQRLIEKARQLAKE